MIKINILKSAANPSMMIINFLFHIFSCEIISVTFILVKRLIFDKVRVIHGIRFSWLTGARSIIINKTTFGQGIKAKSRINILVRRKLKLRFIIITLSACLVHFICSNTFYSKFKYDLFSLFDSQNSMTFFNTIKLPFAK